jgi:hypothetical protein
MNSKQHNLEDILNTWRMEVEKSIRQMCIEELNALWESLFADHAHPWSEPFRQFIDENAGSTFYHATTNNRNHVIYCRAKETGIWFVPGISIGLMQTEALKEMKEIVDRLLLPTKEGRGKRLLVASVVPGAERVQVSLGVYRGR